MLKIKIQPKKMAIIVAFIMFLSSFVFVQCEGITDEITEDLVNDVLETAETGLAGVVLNMSKLFNPSLNLFYKATTDGGIGAAEGASDATGLDYSAGETHTILLFREYSQYAGIVLASVLYGWCIIFYFFSGKVTESKDNPIRCTVCYILALLMIYYNQDIMNYFLEVAQLVWQNAIGIDGKIDKTGLTQANIKSNFWLINNIGDKVEIVGIEFAGTTITILLLSLFGIFFVWQLVKGFLRLWLEMAERYLVVCLMIFFFPIVCPFIISKDTTVIIKSFIRMLIGQLFLLTTGFVFMKGFFLILATGNQKTPIGFIFIMAYLRTAQRIDSYMASMGLNVAQTGSGLFDSFAVAAHSIGSAIKGTNELRKGAAGAMKASAIGSGDKTLFKVASAIGFNTGDVVKSGSIGGIKNIGGDMDYLMRCGKAGQKLNAGSVSGETAQKAVSNYMKNPSSADNKAAVSALHNNDLIKALKANGAVPTGMTIKSAQLKQDGTFKVSGYTNDPTKDSNRPTYRMKGTISNSEMNENSIKTGNTQDAMYFTPEKTTEKGQVLPVNNEQELRDALTACGHPHVEGDIKTMDDFNAAVKSGDYEMQEKLTKGGMTEALYEAPFGTQCVTGENCEYGSGMATACIFPDGSYMEYSQAGKDMEVGADSSLNDMQKSEAFFGKTFTDMNHSYDTYDNPDVAVALNNLSAEEKASFGYSNGMDLSEANGGFGIKADFVTDDDGSGHLRVRHGDYDFDREQLDNLYPNYEVAPGATPQRSGYGQQTIDVVNTDTNEAAKMVMNNVAVYGYGKANDRVVIGKYGDSYSASIISNNVTKENNISTQERNLHAAEKKVEVQKKYVGNLNEQFSQENINKANKKSNNSSNSRTSRTSNKVGNKANKRK